MPYWIQATGYIASVLVFATFCMTTMVPLRIAAISSNVGFIAYATFGHLYPVLALHLALLPLNIFRTYRLITLDRKIQQAVRDGFSVEWLKPLMKRRLARQGEILFSRGDEADGLYMLLAGNVLLKEMDHNLGAGDLFGEIALFSADRRRTQTAVAASDIELLWISEKQFSHVCNQNPAVAIYFLRLTTERLLSNAARLREITARN
jgi:CRP/FNR family transcriptional regulator, cyclic AMP receptor protein